MPHDEMRGQPLATVAPRSVCSPKPDDRNPTALPFDPQSYAPAWLARRVRVPLYVAELLTALACLGGGV